MRKDIYALGLKAQPWWWEAWTPNNALSQFYSGDPSSFLPAIGAWYRTRDWLGRKMAG